MCATSLKNEFSGSRTQLGTDENSRSIENRCWHMGCPVKNDDFGGVSPPLAGKLFSVTKSISRNGKHSLPRSKHIMFLTSKNGSNITSRSRLFAGQSEEANRPFPKPTSGTKPIKKGRPAGRLIQKGRLTD